jgi:ATP-dependent DNA ligase
MEPMKAVLTDERFSDRGWIFERKLDGIRCLAFKGEQRVGLRSPTTSASTAGSPRSSRHSSKTP